MAHKNLIITGGIFHPFEDASAALAKVMGQAGIQSDITLDVEDGLASIGSYDLLTIFALRWRMLNHEKYVPYRDEWAFELSSKGQQAITSHVQKGGGLLALHTASICFDTWPEWRDVLGGIWVWDQTFHPPLGTISVEPTAHKHAIISEAQRFALYDEVYHNLERSPDTVPLLKAQVEDSEESHIVGWSHTFGEGRVVYDALGHDAASIEHTDHAQFLRRAALWVLGQPDENVRAA